MMVNMSDIIVIIITIITTIIIINYYYLLLLFIFIKVLMTCLRLERNTRSFVAEHCTQPGPQSSPALQAEAKKRQEMQEHAGALHARCLAAPGMSE